MKRVKIFKACVDCGKLKLFGHSDRCGSDRNYTGCAGKKKLSDAKARYATPEYREWSRERFKRDRDKHRVWQAKWNAKHPELVKESLRRAARKAMMRRYLCLAACPVHHTEEEWEGLLEAYGGRCWKCGTDRNVHRDHIVPLSRGGMDDISNIAPLCRKCNSTKYTSVWFPVCEIYKHQSRLLLPAGA